MILNTKGDKCNHTSISIIRHKGVDKECLITWSGWLWCVDDYKSEWAMWSDPETWAWGD